MRRATLALIVAAVAFSTASAQSSLKRTVVFKEKPAAATLPPAIASPDGLSRWDATSLQLGDSSVVTLRAEGNVVTREVRRDGSPASPSRTVFTDPDGGDGALRWFFPDHFDDLMRPGSRRTIEFEEETEGAPDRLRIDIRAAGIGWIHLPSGPHEAVLQRALVSRARAGGRDFEPEAFVHRWVDPRDGVVAVISGPARADGKGREGVSSVSALDAVIEGASTLRISVSEITSPNFANATYGFDPGAGTAISTLDPNGFANAGALVAADAWDFSGVTSGTQIAFTTTPVNPAQTCNFSQCGYTDPNGQLERSDKGFDNPDPNTWTKVNDVVVREDRMADVTVWLRGGAQFEGKSGSLGSGESRFCYETFGGVTRTPVPLWRFSHQDAPGEEYYFQSGDSWVGGPFNCEQNIFNEVCGGGGTFSHLYIKACGTHTSTQGSAVLKGGVVTVPSGHTFNALVIRTVADFCVYLGSGCSSLTKVDEVRTVNYLWQVPHLGTVARIQSAQNVADANSFTTIAEGSMLFGLFPPRSISVDSMTDTTVSLSWDPGLIPSRIDGYKIYWDTDSGSGSMYAFNSMANPSQASIVGTTATISGLTPGTDYYFTVTAYSDYPPNPATPLPQSRYESILYPTTVSGDPSFVYPVEVQATTTGGACIPAAQVTGVTVTYSMGTTEFCWNATTDPCLTGYQILGSPTVVDDQGYTPVADLGLQNCWSGTVPDGYFIVTAKGTGGNGPWGHYGH